MDDTDIKQIDPKEINTKYYETILIRKSAHYNDTIRAMDIVKKFIIREKKVLVGGMAIDIALKMKNPTNGIYAEDGIPDYDFYSDQHFKDAYDIAQWLNRLNFKSISVINAMHPTTMKVRVGFIVVADITYVPTNILSNIPTLSHKGMLIVHPHYQIIDQHRALSYPYENPPWETVMFRTKKDMTRYDKLYEQYPIRKLYKDDKIELTDVTFDNKLLKGHCVGGFFALSYWTQLAKKMGFNARNDLGSFTCDGNAVKWRAPLDSHGLTLYTDTIKQTYDQLKKLYKFKEERFYEKFLDKLTRKVILDNKFEIFENEQMIAAHAVTICGVDTHVANIQTIMLYLLVNYILLMRIKNIKRGHSFFVGYLMCRDLISWAAARFFSKKTQRDDSLKAFFPTAETYGTNNISESYKVSKINFDYKNRSGNVAKADLLLYHQPTQVYDRDLKYRKVPTKYYDFTYTDSLVFNIDGEQIEPFDELE